MQTLTTGARGLGLLMDLNWDRLVFLGGVTGALYAAAWLGSAYLSTL
ncbi:MAG: hypothetical protein AAFO93_05605 [Pseudomonadota bacterium]